MVERPEEQRLSSPIVPDVNTSLTAGHLRHPRPARLWPLWLVILLLLVALAGLGIAGWQERLLLLHQLDRQEGQLSNIHARFDGFDEGHQDELEPITERLASLDDGQQALRDRLEEQEQLIESIRVASADDTVVNELDSRLAELAEELTALDDLLGVMRQSQDALEAAGEQTRATFSGHMERLEQRLEALAPQLAALDDAQQRLDARLDDLPDVDPQRFDELATELERLDAALEGLDALRDDDRQALAELRDSLGSTRAELTELRQSQLAASAQLEALQSQLEN